MSIQNYSVKMKYSLDIKYSNTKPNFKFRFYSVDWGKQQLFQFYNKEVYKTLLSNKVVRRI